jgi:hypothetical protein
MIRARGGGGLLRFGRCAPCAAQPAPTPGSGAQGDISIGQKQGTFLMAPDN